jgi:hypothetical protein
LAVGFHGSNSGWINTDKLNEWVTLLTELLFIKEYKQEVHGSIAVIKERLRKEGRLNEINTLLGDGALWITLICALDRIKCKSNLDKFKKALMMRDIYEFKDLYRNLNSERLHFLISNFNADNNLKNKLHAMKHVRDAIAKLEYYCEANFEDLKVTQSKLKYQIDDVIWNKKYGYAWIEEFATDNEEKLYVHARLRAERAGVYKSYFLDLQALSGHDKTIQSCVNALQRI